MPASVRAMYAIEKVESGGNNDAVGKSGEITSMQIMPATFKAYSNDVLGYVAEPTKINAEYIAASEMQKWISQGASIKTVALRWNTGGSAKCSSGYNFLGIHFDSCNYVKKVLANY